MLPRAACCCCRVTSSYCTAYSLGWGYTFLLALILVAGVYVVGGVSIARRAGRQPAHSGGPWGQLQLHAHFERWYFLSGLVRDGVVFARARVQGKASGGGSAAAPHEALIGRESRKGRERDEKKSRSSQKEKLKHKQQGGKADRADRAERGEGGGSSPPPAPAPAPAPAPDVAAAVGTASGGGGRWVHLPG